jgi:RNA polymerase sigma-70 factor (ECF subfamily)
MDTAPTALDTSTAENNRFACVAAAWAAHEGELRSFLRRRLRDAAAADDLLQDVFVKAMRQGQGFCTLEQPRAWLFEVARHAAIDRERTRRDAEPIEDHAEQLAAADPDAPPPVDALTNCLTRVIDELAPEDAQIVRACDIGGQTVRAYAELRGVGLAAAKSRLLRARQRLRDRLTDVCRVHFDPRDGSVCGHDGRARPAPQGRP